MSRQTEGYVPGNDFRRDLQRGQVGQDIWQDIITGGAEVKTDYKVARYGNVFAEYECFMQSTQRWEPSGIVSAMLNPETDYWVVVLPATGAALAIPKTVMLMMVYDYKQRGFTKSCTIGRNPTRGVVIPAVELIAALAKGLDQ